MYINLSCITEYLSKNENIKIDIFKRSGDTNSYQRTKMLSKKPEIILTTPESFNLLTISKQEILLGSKYVILDELHSLITTKRGMNLFLNLTKLQSYLLISLSATVSPLEEILELLGKNTKLVKGKIERKREFKAFSPKTKFWLDYRKNQSEMYRKLLNEIKKYKCSIVFTNTRKLAESITIFLKDNLLGELVLIHHGSLSKEVRYKTQEEMKLGKAKVVVSSTSLELGVDIGYVEHVFQISSPKSISRSLQRLGRSGHSHDKLISGTFFSSTVEENIENLVILSLASKNIVDDIKIPKGYLDVLCQFIISVGYLKYPLNKDILFNKIKSIYFYRNLTIEDFYLVLFFLINMKRIYLNTEKEIVSYSNYKITFIKNVGFIIQDISIPVILDNNTIGYINTEFSSELKKDDSFVISGMRCVCIKKTLVKIYVKLDIGKKNFVPKWFSEVLPLNFYLAKNIKKFQIDVLNKLFKKEKVSLDEYIFNKEAKLSILEHFKEQSMWLELKNINDLKEDDILVEIIEKKIIFHTLFGRKVNSCLSKILSLNILKLFKTTVKMFFQDNGFILNTEKVFTLEDIKKLFSRTRIDIILDLKDSLQNSQLFLNVFRKNIYSCMFLHKTHTYKSNVLEIKFLMHKLLSEYKNNLVIKQTYQEIFEDVYDLERSLNIYDLIKNSDYKLLIVNNDTISPFGVYLEIADVDTLVDKSSLIRELKNQTDSYFSSMLLTVEDKISYFPFGIFFKHEKEVILVISDLHLNSQKEIFNRNLSFIENLLNNLNFYINLIKPNTVILLGDIKDNIFFTSTVEKDCLQRLFSFLKEKIGNIILIKGNHDANLNIDIATYDYLVYGNIFLTHGHRKYDISSYKYIILGHEHSAFDLSFESGVKGIFRCFFVSELENESRIIVLPSISAYKSGTSINTKEKFISPILRNSSIKKSHIWLFYNNFWYKKAISLK